MIDFNSQSLKQLVSLAVQEDVGQGDITTAATVPAEQMCVFKIIAHQSMYVCGLPIVPLIFKEAFDEPITFTNLVSDGDKVDRGTVILEGKARAHVVLVVERVILNFLQHLSGIATFTAHYVKAVKGTKAQILDTRKTIPGLREIEKYAVYIGGGGNHRIRLDDAVLIKDNHIALNSTLTEAISKAIEHVGDKIMVEVECDTIEQVEEALSTNVDRIMLDNMSLEDMQLAVKIADGSKKLEASGNIDLDNVRLVAETGVDYISIGKLTHSAPAVDIGMDITYL